MSDNQPRTSWKQCALLLILLSHAVFGSPIVPAVGTAYESLEPVSQADISNTDSFHVSIHQSTRKIFIAHAVKLRIPFLVQCNFWSTKKRVG